MVQQRFIDGVQGASHLGCGQVRGDVCDYRQRVVARESVAEEIVNFRLCQHRRDRRSDFERILARVRPAEQKPEQFVRSACGHQCLEHCDLGGGGTAAEGGQQ